MNTPAPHTHLEDAQALAVGTLFAALAVQFLRTGGLLTGGSVGIAFLIHYYTHWPYGWVFFAVNLPFYVFAVRTLGWVFTFKTFGVVALMSLYTEWLPHLVRLDDLNPIFAAVMGGLLAGVGLLMLIRHKASLGGVGVVAIFAQQRFGFPAGKLQMAIDATIVAASMFIVDPSRVALSVLGVLALNMVIWVNHRPGRYIGF